MRIPNKTIIGIAGKMGSGKDTAAGFLECGHGFMVMRFADALKEAACIIFGWNRADLEDLTFKMTIDPFWGETPRALLQKFGTEACRNAISREIWVKALERRIHNTDWRNIVITDVRFMNEADAVESWGGRLVKVLRPGYVAPGATPEALNHPSETDLDGYNERFILVHNDRGMNELKDTMDIVASLIKGEA